jgi:nucleoside-triphosphatase THEP1
VNYLHLPEIILAGNYLQFGNQPRLIIITGESGAGKTTACQFLIHRARQQCCQTAGLVSPPVYRSGKKVAIDLTDISTGETRRLAWKRELPALGWEFDPAAIFWGNQVLDELPVSPLLILDELGPLEFQKGAGFTAGLRLLDEQRHRTACVVIRTVCLPVAVERWPWAQVVRALDNASVGEQP